MTRELLVHIDQVQVGTLSGGKAQGLNPQERFSKRRVVTTDGCVNASDVIPSRRDVFDLGVVASRTRAPLPDLAISDTTQPDFELT